MRLVPLLRYTLQFLLLLHSSSIECDSGQSLTIISGKRNATLDEFLFIVAVASNTPNPEVRLEKNSNYHYIILYLLDHLITMLETAKIFSRT